MYCLKLLVLLGSAHCMLAQFLSEFVEVSSEEVSSQGPGARGTSCRCGWTNKQGRIVGGKQVQPNEFPFMVGLYHEPDGLFCGGSIISERLVLTAAHCTMDYKNVEYHAVIGTYDLAALTDTSQTIAINYTVEHEKYNKASVANDIAIAVLKSSIVFNQQVGPVCMPTERTYLIGEFVKVIGWGYLDSRTYERSHHLMKVNLKVVHIFSCNRYLRDGFHVNEDNQICTFRTSKDSCGGDSGGPVLWLDPETNRLTQVALVSYGSRYHHCGESAPAVNTNVFDYLPWIRSTIAGISSDTNLCQKV